MTADLRLGRWQDVLADVETCDAVITDPPYSERTHAGALAVVTEGTTVRGVGGYGHMTAQDVKELVRFWSARCTGWMVFHTDDVLFPFFRETAEWEGRYTFPILPVLQQQPRVSGDGPSSCGHFLAVSRPREKRFLSWGSLPGWYESPRDGSIVRGGKPVSLVRKIIRDYTRPGALIVDPYAGGGTTLLAAAIEGRRAIGAEMDPATYAKARARLARGHTPVMFG